MTTYNLTAEFASQAIELNNRIPYGYVDKTICGCGLTTLALENDRHTIILAPNVALVENKAAQYPNKRSNNIIFGVHGNVQQSDVDDYVAERLVNDEIVKIFVTYDSLWKVEKWLHLGDIIVDESDRLLMSSKLKVSSKKDEKDVDVLTYLFNALEQYKANVSFISATPTPVEYLPEWVQGLEQVKINWQNTITATPYLMERTYPTKSLTEEIIRPLNTDGVVSINDIEAKKVIVFLNSVTEIKKVITEANLSSDDVALVIGDSATNDLKIRGYNRLENPTNLPKFTFCTSTGFQGIDLEDVDAVSIVVSNTSKAFTMIDLTTDLKQAISRQRRKDNVHYGKYIYIYNQSVFSKTEDEVKATIDDLYASMQDSISLWDIAVEKNLTRGFAFSNDFIAYTIHDYIANTYRINELAFNADKYFILETRKQYTKGFNLRGSFDSYNEVETVELPKSVSFADLAKYFNENNKNGVIEWGVYSTRVDWIKLIETYYKLYKRAVLLNVTYVTEWIEAYTDISKQLKLAVHSLFNQGTRYTRKEVKDKLQGLYDANGIKRKAKHTDAYEFFAEIKEVKSSGERMMDIIKK